MCLCIISCLSFQTAAKFPVTIRVVMRFRSQAQPWEGPIDRELAGFNAMVKALHQ